MSDHERFDHAAHVVSWLQWRWYLYRAAGGEEPDEEWHARTLAETNGMGPLYGPPSKEWNDDLARLESPENKFRLLWSKIRPYSGPMPAILPRSADEVYEIVQRLIALADTLAKKGVATDDTREFAALLGPTCGRRTTKAAAQKLAAILASGGVPLRSGRGPKSKPLRDREVRGLTALARDLAPGENRGEIDDRIGRPYSLGVRRVEALRAKRGRSRQS